MFQSESLIIKVQYITKTFLNLEGTVDMGSLKALTEIVTDSK